jgi:DNA polymerase sigma
LKTNKHLQVFVLLVFTSKINYKSAYNGISELKKQNLIDFKENKNIKLCYLTNNFSSLIYKVEYERKLEFIKKRHFEVLLNRLEKIPYNYIVLVFGSYVNNNITKNSDIDLLIITSNEKEIQLELDILPCKNYNLLDFIKLCFWKKFLTLFIKFLCLG